MTYVSSILYATIGAKPLYRMYNPTTGPKIVDMSNRFIFNKYWHCQTDWVKYGKSGYVTYEGTDIE